LKGKRGHERFIRRLETEFTSDDKNYRGITSDLSINGLFVRTNHAFAPDTLIDIVIHLPESSDVKLKGRVIRSIKTPVVSLKNGMGVEILESNPKYIAFVKTVIPNAQEEPDSEGPTLDTTFYKHVEEPLQTGALPPEFTITPCPQCGVRNKVQTAKLSLGPKCGKCGSLLTAEA
jgi:Tfp pilus assembly protein PilZ